MVRNYIRTTEDRFTKKQLTSVISKIKEGKLTVEAAAKSYPISRATIYRHMDPERNFDDRRKRPWTKLRRSNATRRRNRSPRWRDKDDSDATSSNMSLSSATTSEEEKVDDDEDTEIKTVRKPRKMTKAMQQAREKLRTRQPKWEKGLVPRICLKKVDPETKQTTRSSRRK